MTDDNPEFANDLLRGAAEIAFFMYADRALYRRVYHLYHTSNAPFFKCGSMIHGRRSSLLQWISDSEHKPRR